jgi:hypothetical protein
MRALRAIVLITAFLAAGASPALAVIGVFPEEPTANDPIEIVVTVSCGCRVVFNPPNITGDGRILIFGKRDNSDVPEPPLIPLYLKKIQLGHLPAGTWRVEVRIEGTPVELFEFAVAPAVPSLHFEEARLSVQVHWQNPYGPGEGTGKPVVLTPQSGYFYFFDRSNVELTVKLLDGRPVNGRWWLFIASMTTVELEIEVTQCPPEGLGIPCLTRTYVQPPGQNRNFVDTSTFSF